MSAAVLDTPASAPYPPGVAYPPKTAEPHTLPAPATVANLPDRVLAEAIYRAMRMIAAAVKARYGITITVEISH